VSFKDDKSKVKVLSSKPVDWDNTLHATGQVKALRYILDEENNVSAQPVILLFPNQGTDYAVVPNTGVPSSDARSDITAWNMLSVIAAEYLYNGSTWDRKQSYVSGRGVSAVNTAQTQYVFPRNLYSTLAIHQVASAGTASLEVSVSVNGSDWLILETIAAAATISKQYTPLTVGATIALSPLSFPYIRLISSTAGAGNTTTTTFSMK